MESIYENYYYTLNLKDYEKRNIRRIYLDIIENMNVTTMQYYTAKDWMIINSMTTMLRRELKIEEPMKLIEQCGGCKSEGIGGIWHRTQVRSLIVRCDYICDIVRLALDNPNIFIDKKTEDEFWLCMVELCNNTNFDLFLHNETYENNRNIYFTELVHSLYLNILNSSEKDTDKIRFKSFVIILFYIYKRCLDKKIDIFVLEFPETTIEKIKNVKNIDNMSIGCFLLNLVDYNNKNKKEKDNTIGSFDHFT